MLDLLTHFFLRPAPRSHGLAITLPHGQDYTQLVCHPELSPFSASLCLVTGKFKFSGSDSELSASVLSTQETFFTLVEAACGQYHSAVLRSTLHKVNAQGTGILNTCNQKTALSLVSQVPAKEPLGVCILKESPGIERIRLTTPAGYVESALRYASMTAQDADAFMKEMIADLNLLISKAFPQVCQPDYGAIALRGGVKINLRHRSIPEMLSALDSPYGVETVVEVDQPNWESIKMRFIQDYLTYVTGLGVKPHKAGSLFSWLDV